MTAPLHPSVARLGRLAKALGELSQEVVFIGGAIAPLLQDDPPFAAARPTIDVDAVILLPGYSAMGTLAVRLRGLGFRHDVNTGAHLHRWVSPDGDLLDLVPAGEHPGASGQLWDRMTIDTADLREVAPGCTVRIASAPMFLVLKLAAYVDRGARDPFASHDLEDVLALLASRPLVVGEVRKAPVEARRYLAAALRGIQGRSDFDDLLAAHLNSAQEPVCVMGLVRKAIEVLTSG